MPLSVDVTSCGAYNWNFNGQTYTQSGTYSGVNTCGDTLTLNLTVNTIPPTAASQTFLPGQTVADLVGTGTNLQWYAVSSGGTALASTTALATGTYYVSQTLNSCESSRTPFMVTVLAAPTASAQTFCSGATVADLVATGTDLQWYETETAGTALVSTAVLASGTYYVSQTLNNTESSRTSVVVTITPSTTNTTSATACASYTWANNGQTYTASGTYTGTTTNCVTEQLVLTIATPPAQPVIACYETANFNTTTCSWDITGTQPAEPTTELACYQTRAFDTGSCSWVTSGTQPA
jgi:hypothetical protein